MRHKIIEYFDREVIHEVIVDLPIRVKVFIISDDKRAAVIVEPEGECDE